MSCHNTRMICVCLLSAVGGLSWLAASGHAEDGKAWLFDQFADPDNGGRATARVIYGVPETDDVQVTGLCVSANSAVSSMTFGADIGDLANGKQVSLRFSGGGFDHTLSGQIYRAPGEEGLSGVLVHIENRDPLWAALDEKESLDYLVPGYRAATLGLTRGRDSIKQFVEACRSLAAASTGQQADAASAAGDGDEKEAFANAKELGTTEAWEAFVANYQSGFRADLARAYIKQLGEQHQAATPPPAASPADDFPVVAGSWGGIVRSGPGQSYSKVGSLKEGQQVTLMGRSDVVDNGFPWFKIAYAGGSGYQWGGILCSAGAERPDLFKTCAPSAVKAAPAPPAIKKATAGCDGNQIRIEGRCVRKEDAASFCGPGHRLKGDRCVQGYAEPKPQKQLPSWQIEAIKKGCRPGQGWNPQEGCHEND